MDYRLTSPSIGLHVEAFARQWKVSTKTVYRDLEAFKELGQEMLCEKGEDGRYVWAYAAEVEPLFVKNLP